MSALGNVKKIWIYNCAGITDLSALGNVKNLKIDNCAGITDVSALGNVKNLCIYYCPGITTNVLALKNVINFHFISYDNPDVRW